MITVLKNYIQKVTWSISPRLSCAISYIHNRCKWPDFRNPKDLSEIVFSQILSGEVCKYVSYVDKIAVRGHVEEWGLGEYLPKIYGIWDKAEDIPFEKLPNQFALKTNNFVGGHMFCYNKNSFDFDIARQHMNRELNKVSKNIREIQYNKIIPKIFAEELIVDNSHLQPIDYKFHCCDGKVNGCLIVLCRGEKTGKRLVFYNEDWKKQDAFLRGKEKYKGECPKPDNYEQMLSIAKFIANKFTQVRVDMYNVNGKIYIGELTFTPEGGMMSYYTNQALKYLGHKSN